MTSLDGLEDAGRIGPVAPTEAPLASEPAQTTKLAEVEAAGSLEMVRLSDLNIDPVYQRGLRSARIQEYAADYDEAVAGALTLSRREDGTLWIVNGAHRTAGAILAGKTTHLARVLSGLTPRQEALLRIKGNVGSPDTSAERFKAQVAAGDVGSLAIVEIADLYGAKINIHGPDAKGINAISAIEALYTRDQGILLGRTFELLTDCFGEINGQAAGASMLKATAWLIDQHATDFERSVLIDKARRETARGIDSKARAMKAAMGGSLWVNYYRAWVEVYNERMPESRRLMWQTPRGSFRG